MRFVEQRVSPTFEEEERLDAAPLTHIVDTTVARVVALVSIDQPDDIRLVLQALNKHFTEPDMWLAQVLKDKFPWLGGEDSVSGADVVEQLSEWYEELRND